MDNFNSIPKEYERESTIKQYKPNKSGRPPRVVLKGKQEEHLEAIKWLCSDEKGKTYLIAYCLVQKANNNRGEKIAMWDHKYCKDIGHVRQLVDKIATDLNLKAEFCPTYSFRIRRGW